MGLRLRGRCHPFRDDPVRFPYVVAADRESRKVERDRDDAFLRADGIAGRLSTCAHHFGLRPGNAVVYRAAEQNVSMLPAFDNVEDCVVAVPPDFRRMIIHVLRIPERRGGLPFVRAEAQARGGVRGGEIGFSQGTRELGVSVHFLSAMDRRCHLLLLKLLDSCVRSKWGETDRKHDTRQAIALFERFFDVLAVQPHSAQRVLL